MRDLLGDLVRRTLRPELAVQPRLPSRYELRDDRGDAAAIDAHPAPLRATRRAPDDDAPAARPTSAEQPAPTRGPERSEGRERPDPMRGLEGLESRSGRTAGTTSTTPPPAADIALPRAMPVPVGVGRARDLTPPPSPAVPSTPPARHVTAEPNPSLARPPAAVVRTAAATATVGRAMVAVAREDPSGDDSRSATPDIHISIGRIEVRATPRSAAGLPRQVGQTRVEQSLNEYLDTRARGGRR